MKDVFPYEEYKNAIEAESKVRATGVEATVLAVEGDATREGCIVVGVEFKGRFDEGLYENGTLTKDGACIGRIVAFADDDAGMVVVESRGGLIPAAGDTVTFVAADYFEPLREFAEKMLAEPERRNESRFMRLRETLLAPNGPKPRATGCNPNLRWAQELALMESERRRFSLLWGPPGTGKSYTLGHMAEHYRSKGKRVLVLSTTNAAVDVAVFAIDDACARSGRPLAEGELIRYAQTLTQPDEYDRRAHLMAFTKLLRKFAAEQRKAEKSLAEERRSLAGLESGDPEYLATLMRVTKLLETLRLIGQRRREEIGAMTSGAKIVCSTITTCLYNGFMAGDFDVVLVDEASQVSLAVWPCLMNRAGKKKFVVAGDPMQLEPVGAKDADVNTQFWFNQNIYAYLGMTSFRGIEPFYEAGAMTLLNEQTRMRKGICEVVSKLFYNGLLVGDRDDAPFDFSGTSLPAGDVAVLDPSEQGEAFGFDRLPASRFRKNANLESASSVLRVIREVVSLNPKGRKLDVLVLSPFRDQCKLYGPRLKVMPHGDDVTLRASTVHSCQGGEADLVFFDLVNPASPFISRAHAAHLWCVACSRARQKLVIVGDKAAMRLGRYSSAILREVNLMEPAVVSEPGSYRVAV